MANYDYMAHIMEALQNGLRKALEVLIYIITLPVRIFVSLPTEVRIAIGLVLMAGVCMLAWYLYKLFKDDEFLRLH